MTEEIMSAVSGEVFGVWFLIGAALVFWMQAGFAMVEAGFTRAKNTGNIIMKNLMDFCIGPASCLILCSVPPRQPLFPGLYNHRFAFFRISISATILL